MPNQIIQLLCFIFIIVFFAGCRQDNENADCNFDRFFTDRPLRVLVYRVWNEDGQIRADAQIDDELSTRLSKKVGLESRVIEKGDLVNMAIWVVPKNVNYIQPQDQKFYFLDDDEAIKLRDGNQWIASIYFQNGSLGRFSLIVIRDEIFDKPQFLEPIIVAAMAEKTVKKNVADVIEECYNGTR